MTLQVNACAVWPASVNGVQERPSYVRPTVCFPNILSSAGATGGHLVGTVTTAHTLVLGLLETELLSVH